jgi:osmoprotectant transport system permease protein
MSIVLEALQWLLDPAQFTGPGSIPERVFEHLDYTARAVGIAALVAIPTGYYIGHTGRGKGWIVAVSGAARALPTFGLMLYLVLLLGVSQRVTAALIGLVLLAIPPLLAGAYAGVGQIDPRVIDAARAQGMTEWQILTRVEVPLSLSLVIGGFRGSILQVVATATLVSYVGLGGLGFPIIQGIPLRRFDQVVGAALIIIVLAFVLDATLAALARLVTPVGVIQGRASDVRARGGSPQPASTGEIPVAPTRNTTQRV